MHPTFSRAHEWPHSPQKQNPKYFPSPPTMKFLSHFFIGLIVQREKREKEGERERESLYSKIQRNPSSLRPWHTQNQGQNTLWRKKSNKFSEIEKKFLFSLEKQSLQLSTLFFIFFFGSFVWTSVSPLPFTIL